jgi:hypothetical protein
MQEQTQFEPFVDANAVAGHLKVTRRQVLEMTRYGVIPGHPLGTGSKRSVWRYKLSEIDAAVRSSGTNPSQNTICQNAMIGTIKSGSPRIARKGNFNG